MKCEWYLAEGDGETHVGDTEGFPPPIGSAVYLRNMLIDYTDAELDDRNDPASLGRLGHLRYIVKRADHTVCFHSHAIQRIADATGKWISRNVFELDGVINDYLKARGETFCRLDVTKKVVVSSTHVAQIVVEKVQ